MAKQIAPDQKLYLVFNVICGLCSDYDPGPYSEEELDSVINNIVEQEEGDDNILIYEIAKRREFEKQYRLKKEK